MLLIGYYYHRTITIILLPPYYYRHAITITLLPLYNYNHTNYPRPLSFSFLFQMSVCYNLELTSKTCKEEASQFVPQ